MRIGDEIIGEVHGKLTIIGRALDGNGHTLAVCRCECGSETTVLVKYIRCGNTRSCGCSKKINNASLVGKKFGRLTVVAVAEKGKYFRTLVRCKCDCGKEKEIVASRLISGHTSSCGCLKIEIDKSGGPNLKHGHARIGKSTKEYQCWNAMMMRCTNPNHKDYGYYGSRGITVCPEWRDFNNFLRDMGTSPSGTSIDRIDNDKGYFKGNCKWSTRKEQSANRRNTIWIELNGERKPLHTWAKELGICGGTAYSRYQMGWPAERLFTREKTPEERRISEK